MSEILEQIIKSSEKSEELERLEIIKQLLSTLTDTDKIILLSDLSEKEINDFAFLLTFAEYYDLDFVKQYVKNLLLLRVSKKRKGRSEILNAIKSISLLTSEKPVTEKENILKRILRV